MKDSSEIIVVGGGIIGCAIAYELAKAGREVLVIERGEVAGEASSAAAGMLAAQLSHALEKMPEHFFRLQLESRDLFPALVRELERETGMDVGYRESGLLYVVFSKKEASAISKKIEEQKKRGLQALWLSEREVRQREPAVDGSIHGGFFFPKDPQVDNTRLTLAYARAAKKKGAKFLLGHTAKRLHIEKNRTQGVQTTSGRICRSPIVINACGSWASFDKSLPFKMPVFPARGQILAFQFGEPPIQTPILSHAAYGVLREKGRYLVGTTVEFVGFQKRVTKGGRKAILEGFSRISSCLVNRSPIEEWAGFRPCTPDHLPILGPTPIKGFYLANGHFRDGILLAPITAKLMAELVIRDKRPSALRPYLLERFLKAKQPIALASTSKERLPSPKSFSQLSRPKRCVSSNSYDSSKGEVNLFVEKGKNIGIPGAGFEKR